MPSMALFSNTSARSSKRTTPRGTGNSFVGCLSVSRPRCLPQATTTPFIQQQHRTESGSSLAPEKTGDSISPSHRTPTSTTAVTLNSMEVSSTNKPPSGRGSPSILDQRPESMVAETLKMKGELEFTRLLRVDGRFQGELITDKGSLVVGPKGEVIGDLKNMQEVYVEGIVRGNVFATDVKIKKNGMLLGDIQCTYLTLDPTASIKGVADTATMKERVFLEANQPPPSSGTTSAQTSTAAPVATVAPPMTPPSRTSVFVQNNTAVETTTSTTASTSSADAVVAGEKRSVNEEEIIPAPSPS
ncbi:unnamed protein product [Pylaiella littoralis]